MNLGTEFFKSSRGFEMGLLFPTHLQFNTAPAEVRIEL